MKNHSAPDFGMDDEFTIPTASAAATASCPRKLSMGDDEIMELLWHNGQVVMQTQNQRSAKKSSPSFKYPIGDAILAGDQEIRTLSTSAPPPEDVSATYLFMQEDEMASWLHYPLDDTPLERDFCADFLYPPPPSQSVTVTAAENVSCAGRSSSAAKAVRPPMPPVRGTATAVETSRFSNFTHFSRMKGARAESGPSDSNKGKRESTVVDSSNTPAIEYGSRASQLVRSTGDTGDITGYGRRSMTSATMATTSSAGKETMNCDVSVTFSPGDSGASICVGAEPAHKPQAEVRQALIEAECYSQDVEFEPADAKNQAQGSTSTKRSRAAEVHNLSERRRRDRINEKMKALQELIPHCNKSDKASMLDEAIEYLKSLQMQVQMMSMGCSMVPMMFPGVQQYMPPMGMGMGVGMDMSMSRPIMPYPSVLAGSPVPNPAAAIHMGPRFPMPAYHMQPVPTPDLSRVQAIHQSDPMLRPLTAQNINQARFSNCADPYQWYMGLHQMQMPIPQNQSMAAQPGTRKPSINRGAENLEHQQSG